MTTTGHHRRFSKGHYKVGLEYVWHTDIHTHIYCMSYIYIYVSMHTVDTYKYIHIYMQYIVCLFSNCSQNMYMSYMNIYDTIAYTIST